METSKLFKHKYKKNVVQTEVFITKDEFYKTIEGLLEYINCSTEGVEYDIDAKLIALVQSKSN